MAADISVRQAQADVRRVYRGGQFGPLVSAVLWLAAAITGDLFSGSAGVAVLFFGGMLIFPVSTLALKLAGGPAALPRGHPMVGLATQAALTVPFGMLVAILLYTQRPEWFFPAALVLVGAHYLPFVHLYGMADFAVAAVVMIGTGMLLVLTEQSSFSIGGYLGALILLAFAVLCRARAPRPATT